MDTSSLGVEERMLLLYVMLVENDSFRVYVLSRTDPETMVRSWKHGMRLSCWILRSITIVHPNVEDNIRIRGGKDQLFSGVYLVDDHAHS